MRAIRTTDAPDSPAPLSQGVVSGDTAYVSGQGPLDPDSRDIVGTDGSEQAHQVLDNVEAILEDAGASLDDVVKTTVYVTDIGAYEDVNDAYASRFSEPYPARTAIEVADLPVDILVEMDVIAAI